MDKDTFMFLTGMTFALAMYMCWQSRKVANEAIKILREDRKD